MQVEQLSNLGLYKTKKEQLSEENDNYMTCLGIINSILYTLEVDDSFWRNIFFDI